MANDSILKRITSFLFLQLLDRVVMERRPDFIIGGDSEGGPYLRRWWLIPRNRWFNVYLHHFMRDDDGNAIPAALGVWRELEAGRAAPLAPIDFARFPLPAQ